MTPKNTPDTEPDITEFLRDYDKESKTKVRKTLESYRDEFRKRYALNMPTTPNVNMQSSAESGVENSPSLVKQLEEARKEFDKNMEAIYKQAAIEEKRYAQVANSAKYTSEDSYSSAGKALAIGAGFAGAEAVLGATGVGVMATGSYAALAAGVVYGMGRLEGRAWKRPKAGFGETLVRGLVSPITLTGWGIGKLWKGGKNRAKNNIGAIPKMLKGESPIVKAASFPVWWPVRSTFRTLTGFKEGLQGKGIGNAKGMAKLGYPFGKALRLPTKDLYDYAMSPAK